MTRRTAVQALAAAAVSSMPSRETRFVGITVMPEYIQTETTQRVLDNLVRRTRATAVTTSSWVMEPADPKTPGRTLGPGDT